MPCSSYALSFYPLLKRLNSQKISKFNLLDRYKVEVLQDMTSYHSFVFALFSSFIQIGSLEVRFRGSKTLHKSGVIDGPKIIISLSTPNLLYRFLFNAELSIPEAYMSGDLRLINTSLDDFLIFLMRNKQYYKNSRFQKFIYSLRGMSIWLSGRIKRRKAKANVAHHYDLTDTLYQSFLDERRQYSCAYFRKGDDLDYAQARKIARLAAKLRLKSNGRILDIGCGWGELAYAKKWRKSAELVVI